MSWDPEVYRADMTWDGVTLWVYHPGWLDLLIDTANKLRDEIRAGTSPDE